MNTRLLEKADSHGQFDLDRRRSGVFRGVRFARRSVAVVGLGAAMALPVATTMTAIAAPAAGAAGGCHPKLSLIKGQPVLASCGPASAKLHYKGKTYTFKSGTCFRDSSGVTLSLGKNIDVKGNLGLVGMSITLSASGPLTTVTANKGNVHLSTAVATSSKIARTGTINGTNGSVPFTVTWNCGGPFSKP